MKIYLHINIMPIRWQSIKKVANLLRFFLWSRWSYEIISFSAFTDITHVLYPQKRLTSMIESFIRMSTIKEYKNIVLLWWFSCFKLLVHEAPRKIFSFWQFWRFYKASIRNALNKQENQEPSGSKDFWPYPQDLESKERKAC